MKYEDHASASYLNPSTLWHTTNLFTEWVQQLYCFHFILHTDFILDDFYYYFIQQICAYYVNFSDTGASDIGHVKGYLTWLAFPVSDRPVLLVT